MLGHLVQCNNSRWMPLRKGHTITPHKADDPSTRVSLTPLSIHDMPCNSSFEDQEIDLGQCPPVFELSLPFSNPIDFPMFHGSQQLTIPRFNYTITLLMFYPFCPSTIKLYRILMTFIPNWVEKSPSSFVTFITTSPSYNQ